MKKTQFLKEKNLLASSNVNSLGEKIINLFAEKGQLIVESDNEEDNTNTFKSSKSPKI